MKIANLLVILAFVVSTCTAYAKENGAAVGARELAVCGESHGYSFYPKLGLVPAKEDKWVSDSVQEGRIKLTMTPHGEYDILYANAAGGVGSARNDGAVVATLGEVGNSLGIVVTYPEIGETETYAFFVNANGKAEVMWTVNRYGPLVRKVSAFKANCSFFALSLGD